MAESLSVQRVAPIRDYKYNTTNRLHFLHPVGAGSEASKSRQRRSEPSALPSRHQIEDYDAGLLAVDAK